MPKISELERFEAFAAAQIISDEEWNYIYIGEARSYPLENAYNEGKIDSDDIKLLLTPFLGNVRKLIFKDPKGIGGVILFVGDDAPKAD